MENTEIIEIIGPARDLALRILAGWQPTSPPSELAVKRFRWGNNLPLAAVAKTLSIEGPQMTVICGATSGEMFDAFMAGGLRNESVEGDADEEFAFRAQYAAVTTATFGHFPFECVNWTLGKRDARPTVWVGWFEQAPKVRVTNLSIYGGDSGCTTGLRLEAKYIHYLIPWRSGRVWYIVEPRDGASLDESVLNREMLALEFVLGRTLNVEILYGLDECCNVVTYKGNHLGYGFMPHHADPRPPVGYEMDHAPTVALFDAMCTARITEEEDALLRRSISSYLDTLGRYMEMQCLELNVAAEALARHLSSKSGEKERRAYLSRDHGEWKTWCKSLESEITKRALPGKGKELFNHVLWADRDGASVIVVATCQRLGISIDDAMVEALKVRNILAHGDKFPFTDNIDNDVVIIDAPRTMLIAFMAKLVGYSGPILGYHDRGNPVSPPWWTEGKMPLAARRKYRIT